MPYLLWRPSWIKSTPKGKEVDKWTQLLSRHSNMFIDSWDILLTNTHTGNYMPPTFHGSGWSLLLIIKIIVFQTWIKLLDIFLRPWSTMFNDSVWVTAPCCCASNKTVLPEPQDMKTMQVSISANRKTSNAAALRVMCRRTTINSFSLLPFKFTKSCPSPPSFHPSWVVWL